MFIDRFGRKMFENDPDVTSGSSDFDDETHDDDEEINESKVERINDKGDEVPEKCDKCGSHIGLYLKGEPVWLCSNKKCGKYFGTAPCNFQEGVLNDLKNGVNPYSSKTFFHLSKDSTLNGKTLKPRIPDYISKTKFSEDNPYYEDDTIPRVCFSNSIEGALNAIVNINDGMLEVPQGVRYYVYIPDKPISEYKHKTNKELKKEKLVFDASTTGECWITEPVKLKLYGVIIVQQISDIKERKTVSGHPHGRVDYKWKWVVKPKVVDKSRGRYDGDEDDKYIKEGYRMSSYPSRFETYEEVVQEGMFDAGFHSLRFRLAKELGERFKVSNIMRAMGGANDKFVVSLTDDDSKRADVVNTGTGVKVPGIFNNMSLSGAFRRLVEFFQSPEFLTEYVSPVDENEYVMESDDDTSPDRMTVDDGDSIDLNVDINIDDFGSDTGSTQNDYDPKEVEELNKLIASEASAMGEYLNASKNTNVDVLRRLYADIGDEERFHTEQLLFAKASITGEPYEPRDPEVKKEYEELLAMGMDEETALNTAIDKRNMISSDEGPDIEELDDDIVTTESAINQCIAAIDLMDIIFESTDVYSSETVDRCVGIFAEAFCESSIGEEVFSEAVLDPNEYKTPNPFVLIFRGWISLCKFIKQLVKNITIFVNKIMQKQAARNAWVNEHGIAALFKSGVSLYFYEEKYKNNVSGEPLLYAEFLLYLTRMIASTINCGINCDNIHNGLIEGLRAAGVQPIRVNSIEEGLDKISRITLTKTKVVVDKHNQNELIALFIGNARHGGETIYDMMVKVSKIVDNVANYENEFIKWMKDVQGIQDSVYYTNRDGYNTAMSQIKVVNKGFGIFVKALAHDLKVLSEINKRMLEPQKPTVK